MWITNQYIYLLYPQSIQKGTETYYCVSISLLSEQNVIFVPAIFKELNSLLNFYKKLIRGWAVSYRPAHSF